MRGLEVGVGATNNPNMVFFRKTCPNTPSMSPQRLKRPHYLALGFAPRFSGGHRGQMSTDINRERASRTASGAWADRPPVGAVARLPVLGARWGHPHVCTPTKAPIIPQNCREPPRLWPALELRSVTPSSAYSFFLLLNEQQDKESKTNSLVASGGGRPGNRDRLQMGRWDPSEVTARSLKWAVVRASTKYLNRIFRTAELYGVYLK